MKNKQNISDKDLPKQLDDISLEVYDQHCSGIDKNTTCKQFSISLSDYNTIIEWMDDWNIQENLNYYRE